MLSHVPRLPFSLDPLIREAKRRVRRRSVLVAVVLVVVASSTLAAVIATRSPAGAYTSIAWTRGHHTQMRYCRRPDLAGASLAASAGVTCQTAEAIASELTSRCYRHSPCEAGSFRCVAYWSGRFWSSFEDTNHALCSDGSRRVVWDGG